METKCALTFPRQEEPILQLLEDTWANDKMTDATLAMLLIAVVDMIAIEAITAGVIADMTATVPEVMTVMTVVTVVTIAIVAAAVVMTVIAEAMTGGVMTAVQGPDPPGVEHSEMNRNTENQ